MAASSSTPTLGNRVARGLIALCAALVPLDCSAYIDPNAGGWLFQLLFPLLVAIAGAWMAFRQRVAALWNRLFQGKQVDKDHD